MALADPKLACSLFVPRAYWGGTPRPRSTGMVISPPPPAMASMSPATAPVKKRMGK